MKKLSYSFQKGNFWSKLLWIVGLTLSLIVGWYVIESVGFFLQTTVGTIGLLFISPIVAIGIIAFSIVKYPRVKEANEYSEYTRKYL
ncbi:MAG: hypothetical protein E6618_13300 [Staphylococcus warneri]|nr:hypothetical protein [Staphylococcus lugdunensis]MDU6255169.1 hypothetical protein [Staphylococcus warneri]